MYNKLTVKEMKQEFITEIRLRLDFIEKFETLVGDAKSKGDEEWEDELHARLSFAESDLKYYVGLLLGDKQEQDDELPF
jgi:hypothetical protein